MSGLNNGSGLFSGSIGNQGGASSPNLFIFQPSRDNDQYIASTQDCQIIVDFQNKQYANISVLLPASLLDGQQYYIRIYRNSLPTQIVSVLCGVSTVSTLDVNFNSVLVSWLIHGNIYLNMLKSNVI